MNEMELVDFDTIILNLRENNYRYIGSGSGRRVFDLENGYVVKVAKNKKGIAQNEIEYLISTEHCSLFANITQASYDYNYVIMEKAERLNNFADVRRYYNVSSSRELFQNKELRYIFSTYHLLPVDLCKIRNWGKVDNRPVIIDYGFTQQVKRKYYMPF